MKPDSWIVNPEYLNGNAGICGRLITTSDGEYVISLVLGEIDCPETKSNANLIAAAPDLLAACEAARSGLCNYYGGRPNELVARLSAAIDKARKI